MKSVIENIKHLFYLHDSGNLFKEATTPISCGGDDKFKYLALIGDNILNLGIINNFQKLETYDTGIIQLKKQEIHDKRTLLKLAKHLKIDKLMIPSDKNFTIQDDDLKESIESLLGASFQINGLEKSYEIVDKLIGIIEKEQFKVFDYISLLQIYCDKRKINHPKYPDPFNFGLDHDPRFKQIILLDLKEKFIELTSEEFTSKSDAKKRAAELILIKIGEINDEGYIPSKLPAIKTKVRAEYSISIDQDEIIFQNDENKYYELLLNKNTGELLIDWAKRKMKKNSFGMLLLLSARISEISGVSWTAEINGEYFALLNLKLGLESYFEIGYGLSKTKARKEASNKLIERINLYSFLENNYSDVYI